MPTYEHECADHGVFNDVRPMSASGDKADCPFCGKSCTKVFHTSPALMRVDGNMWHDENGGKGRYIGQLADKPNDPKAYCSSQRDAMEKAKRQGYSVERL